MSEVLVARRRRILAIDGGDSKTDIVLVNAEGQVLGARRVPMSSHAGLDRVGARDALDRAIRSVCRGFGVDPGQKPIAEVGVYCLAGADLPVDERRIHRMLTKSGWTAKTLVRNDTLAVLRAGTDRGWGIGIVCGSGMNAAGVGPDQHEVRFQSFGEVSGDLAAGGGWIGLMALAHAVRAHDGRGSATVLERSVPGYFAQATPEEVTESLYLGRLQHRRLVELAPLVFKAAGRRDRVARQIIDRVADEVVAFATAAIKRLHLTRRDVEVILGGGIFRADDRPFQERIRRGIQQVAPRAVIRRLDAPPVVGAALLGLDALGAEPAAATTLRRSLTYALLAASPDGNKRRPRRLD